MDLFSIKTYLKQDNTSLANSFQRLPTKKKKRVLDSLSEEESELLNYTWEFWARGNQLPPIEYWNTWVVLAGRGFGKSRIGSEIVNKWAREKSTDRIAIVGPTISDTRDVMVEGESGILVTAAPDFRPVYNPSKRLLTWPNGVKAFTYSGDEPERLRGPQHGKAWIDEFCSFRYPHAIDMLDMGLRLSDHPQKVITTTPKPTRALKQLLSHDYTVVTRGSTYDNKDNLPKIFIDQIIEQYEGTRLGRQELHAEVLDEAENALWTRDLIDDTRVKAYPELSLIVVAIDPTVSNNKNSDECGIVIAGRSGQQGYVLEDASLKVSTEKWAKRAIAKYHQYDANYIVYEKNNGGDLVKDAIKNIDKGVPVRDVHASRGKYARAEPIAQLYEQKRIHHVGYFEKLEEQMCTFDPNQSDFSPDRMDALVWAIYKLFKKGHINMTAFDGFKKER